MDDKRADARAFKERSGLQRQILLDDLEGTAHHAYSTLPNMTWVAGRGGFIHYKSAWTSIEDLEKALEEIVDFQENRIKEPVGAVLQRAGRLEHAGS